MNEPIYTSELSDLRNYLGVPLRTKGCVLIYCLSGYAMFECNFAKKPFRCGCLATVFSDTLFSIEKTSRDFRAIKIELSISLTDEVTFISSCEFLDWLADNQICRITENGRRELLFWYKGIKWIEKSADDGFRNTMLRNQWQNFFLGFESRVRPMIDTYERKRSSSSRRLFDRFCQLLSENCRTKHNVKFYADELCITPYYLSKITLHVFSVSPKELIDRQIIMDLKALLATTDLSVKEIAHRYCFESTSYMVRYFKRHVGVTPLDYRRQHNGS